MSDEIIPRLWSIHEHLENSLNDQQCDEELQEGYNELEELIEELEE